MQSVTVNLGCIVLQCLELIKLIRLFHAACRSHMLMGADVIESP